MASKTSRGAQRTSAARSHHSRAPTRARLLPHVPRTGDGVTSDRGTCRPCSGPKLCLWRGFATDSTAAKESTAMTGRSRKILLSLLLIGAASALAGFGTFSAFTSTTTNSGNSFAAGTVFVDDNDAGAAMYSVSNQKPGVATQRCIKVTYSGTMAADVKLYTTSTVGSVGDYIDLTIEKGSGNPSFPNCTGFS